MSQKKQFLKISLSVLFRRVKLSQEEGLRGLAVFEVFRGSLEGWALKKEKKYNRSTLFGVQHSSWLRIQRSQWDKQRQPEEMAEDPSRSH